MTIAELLTELRAKGIDLWVEGDRLRYSAPRGALSPDMRAALLERKSEILAFLHQAQAAAQPAAPPINPIVRDGALPLSFAQQRLWFLYQFEPENTAYNLPMAVRLDGRLDLTALAQSFSQIIQRHESLRTTFTHNGTKQPQQVIHPAIEVYFTSVIWPDLPSGHNHVLIDLRPVSEQECDHVVPQLMREEIARPFNLATGPLMRTMVLQLADESHIVLLTTHHIVSDGWSMGVLINEALSFYVTFATGQPVTLPTPPVQYADYAQWQRDWLRGEVLQKQVDYWKQQLAGHSGILDFPIDYPRKAIQTFPGASLDAQLPTAVLDDVNALSRQENVTPFMVLLAVFATLLYRYTGQTDITVGSPIANRTRPELEGLIGLFVNTLVLRTDLSEAPSFRDLLQRVRQTALGAYAHQDLPFEHLVEALRPQRDLSRSPLFQLLFAVHNEPMPDLHLPGLQMSLIEINSDAAPYEISLHIHERSGHLTCSFGYNTDLFAPETIARLAGHYETLLTHALVDPTAAVAHLPLLTLPEQQALLTDLNQTATSYPATTALHDLLAAQAQRTPHAPAVRLDTREDDPPTLTYAELDAQATQLAQALAQHGIGPGDLVALLLDRTLDLPVALLAVLKTGAAYLPLDPAFPPERLALTLDDAQVALVLTHSDLLPLLPAALPTWRVDQHDVSTYPTTPLVVATHPDALAYVIYTSGSTGRPKGVQITHRAVVNFLWSIQQTPGLTADDTLVAVTTLSFDIAVLELLVPWLVGAQVVLASRATASDGRRLAVVLAQTAATVMQATPATWQLLLAAGWTGQDGLRILCGGEAFPAGLAAQLQACGSAVWNMYGPTETTIWSSVRQVVLDEAPVRVGGPLANTQLYVLDGAWAVVPVGVAGELYIGGVGVARGYVGRPDLTAQLFVPDGVSGRAGQRLYRTGDVVRWVCVGALAFLGRRDQQVKVRGYRIELGDIAAALEGHAEVRRAVVVVWEAGTGRARLVAYVEPEAGALVAGAALRRWVEQVVPGYMVPTQVVVVDALPLTPNGKVDRNALPEPEQPHTTNDVVYVAPRTATERTLADIWCDILGVEQVGVYESFFNLGGHSLLATQLMFRIHETAQVNIPIMAFFANPTIAHLAQTIDTLRINPEAVQTAAGPTPDEMAQTLRADAVLDAAINPQGVRSVATDDVPSRVLLTGATGFIGAFILDELLRQTSTEVYCLVRANTPDGAMQRIVDTLQTYQLWDAVYRSRIVPVPGDLAQPRLGLSDEQFSQFAVTIESIYHSGATTNFIYPYHEIRAANVLGTQEILRLATHTTLKPVHYLSTLYVFSPLDVAGSPTISEQAVPECCEGLGIGYAQSKWVGERLMLAARSRGVPTAIYRLGRVSGHSRTGACRADDFVWQLIKACLESGAIPDIDSAIDMLPVDQVSASIVQLSRQTTSLDTTFHVFNTNPPTMRDIAGWASAFGYDLEQLPFEQWRMRLIEHASQTPAGAASGLLPLLASGDTDLQMSNMHFSNQNTQAGLAGSSIAWSPIDQTMFEAYLTFFVDRGVFSAPLHL